jgi:hypothetical protein
MTSGGNSTSQNRWLWTVAPLAEEHERDSSFLKESAFRPGWVYRDATFDTVFYPKDFGRRFAVLGMFDLLREKGRKVEAVIQGHGPLNYLYALEVLHGPFADFNHGSGFAEVIPSHPRYHVGTAGQFYCANPKNPTLLHMKAGDGSLLMSDGIYQEAGPYSVVGITGSSVARVGEGGFFYYQGQLIKPPKYDVWYTLGFEANRISLIEVASHDG